MDVCVDVDSGRFVSLAAVGDVGLIRNVRYNILKRGNSFPFEKVKKVFAKADVVFGNLEIPFSSIPPGESSAFSSEFWADPTTASSLKLAGFNVMSFSNNHTLERGEEGLYTTLSMLDGLSISAVGAGKNLDDARKLVQLEIRGLNLGFLAYAKTDHSATSTGCGAAPMDRNIMVEDIKMARKLVDVLVVSLHFGMIYMDYPSDEGISVCHQLIDEGVDIILGHHPHVLQGIEEYGGGLIAYSLGEFIFDPRAGLWYSVLGRQTRKESMILMIKMDKQGYQGYSMVPTVLNEDYQPEIPDADRCSEILARIAGLSESIKTMRPEDFYRYAGSRLIKYELNGFMYHFRRFNVSQVLIKLSKIRRRHFRLFFAYLRSAIGL